MQYQLKLFFNSLDGIMCYEKQLTMRTKYTMRTSLLHVTLTKINILMYGFSYLHLVLKLTSLVIKYFTQKLYLYSRGSLS